MLHMYIHTQLSTKQKLFQYVWPQIPTSKKVIEDAFIRWKANLTIN